MSGSTSVPAISFGPNGFVVPAESAIVAGLDADTNAAFGGDLNTDPTTPQGQLISSQAAYLGNSDNQQVLLYNGVDPAYASGRMQDAIGRIYFMTRIAGQPTTLQVACVGLVGVVIPVNAIISDPAGNLYLATASGIIPTSGTITLPFASQVIGPIPVPETVAIYQTIPNWNSATFVSGVVGRNVETRAAFEIRREASVASNAQGFTDAVLGAVLAVPGVIDAYVRDNPTNGSVTVGGVTLAANSLYVAVAGGAAADIGFAIWTKKSPGCSYNGSTSVTVQDPNPAYGGSGPSYTVSWTTAGDIPISFTVMLKNNSGVPSNALTLIQAAIATAFVGDDNGPPARIGQELFASRYYAGIAALGTWVQIISVTIGSEGLPAAKLTATIDNGSGAAGTTLTVSAVASATFTGTGSGTNLTASAVTGTICVGAVVSGTGVTGGTTIVSQISGVPGGAGVYVTSIATTSSGASLTATGVLGVGQFIYGASVPTGTYITALGSGTGGTGTYTVSTTSHIGSEAMTAVAPIYNDVTMNINQEPTFAGGSAIPPNSSPDVNLVLV